MVSPGPGLFVEAAEEAPGFPKAEEEAVADEVEVVAAVVEEPDSLIVF